MGDADFARFLRYALGSATEVECHLLLARDLLLLSAESCDELERDTREVQRMVASLARKLERDKKARLIANSYVSYPFTANVTLCPPNPNEFESATSTSRVTF